MARDTAAQAGDNSTSAQGLSKTYGAAATAGSNILTPTLNRLATAPQGYGQSTINNMNTAALQTIGGANAGTVGGGNQQAASSNNQGGFGAGAVAAGHDATAQLSDAALGVQNRSAQLAEQQRGEGISGLEGMYNTNVGAGENALGLSTSALQAQTAAQNQTLDSWLKPFQTVVGAGAQLGAAALGA